MLTEGDMSAWRERIGAASAKRVFRGPTRRVVLQGGPLQGLMVRVLESEAKSAYLAWAMVTDTGPVQAIYKRLETGDAYGFHERSIGVR